VIDVEVTTQREPQKKDLKFLWLEITNQCNEQCAHCYNKSSPYGTHGKMQTQDWKNVLSGAKAFGTQEVQFIGGEPTTHPALNHLVRFAHEDGLNIEVFTNLVKLTDETLQTFQDCNVSVATSFYSPNPHVHTRITNNKNAHGSIVKNIKRVVDAGLLLRVGLIEFPPDEYPNQDIEGAMALLTGLGVHEENIGFDHVRGIGRGTAIDTQRANSVDALCGACADGKAVGNAKGDVSLCVFTLGIPSMVVGNVKEQSLEAIVADQTMMNMRNDLQMSFSRRGIQTPTDDCYSNTCPPKTPCSPHASPCPIHPNCGPLCFPTRR